MRRWASGPATRTRTRRRWPTFPRRSLRRSPRPGGVEAIHPPPSPLPLPPPLVGGGRWGLSPPAPRAPPTEAAPRLVSAPPPPARGCPSTCEYIACFVFFSFLLLAPSPVCAVRWWPFRVVGGVVCACRWGGGVEGGSAPPVGRSPLSPDSFFLHSFVSLCVGGQRARASRFGYDFNVFFLPPVRALVADYRQRCGPTATDGGGCVFEVHPPRPTPAFYSRFVALNLSHHALECVVSAPCDRCAAARFPGVAGAP